MREGTDVAMPGSIRIDGRIYVWEVRGPEYAQRPNTVYPEAKPWSLLPTAEKILVVRPEVSPGEFLIGIRAGVGLPAITAGPVHVLEVDSDLFPALEVGWYYLVPSFVVAWYNEVDNELVRSLVMRLLSGRRLRRVNPFGGAWIGGT